MTKKQKLNRILKLADFVEKVPRNRFDFSTWVGCDWKYNSQLSCGTAACALGWATTMPMFKKLGVKLRPLTVGGYITIEGETFWTDKGQALLAHALGISGPVLCHLFLPRSCPSMPGLPITATPKQWAEHARQIVKKELANL